jgi:hypothetical protein
VNVQVIGPVNGGARGRPFGSSLLDLAAEGYIEEEFFLDGEATLYALADGADYRFDGHWAIRERGVISFRTRILVRRPVDQERFNGVVVVNWNNVSAGFELPCATGFEIIESGSAWVGASVQRIGLHGHPLLPDNQGLAQWDADRYGMLSISDDDASFDIFTQVARAVGRDRLELTTDPMGGLEVAHVIAFGASQSANRLATYYNAIQPEAAAFDAFLMLVYSGGGTRLEALGPGPSLALVPAEARAIVNVMPFGSHRLRDDIDAPAFVLNSETEAAWYHPVRQPDNDTFRLWEVAGAAHIGAGSGHEVDAQLMRDVGRVLADVLTDPSRPEANTLSFTPVADAALHHVRTWVQGDVAPPILDRIEFADDPPAIARDHHGNARGGVRLWELEVPTGTHVASGGGDGIPDLTGTSTPFSLESRSALFPDRAVFVERAHAAISRGVALGSYLSRDVGLLRAQVDLDWPR